MKILLPAVAGLAACLSLSAAERATVTVTQSLALARPSETILVPWSQLAAQLRATWGARKGD